MVLIYFHCEFGSSTKKNLPLLEMDSAGSPLLWRLACHQEQAMLSG